MNFIKNDSSSVSQNRDDVRTAEGIPVIRQKMNNEREQQRGCK